MTVMFNNRTYSGVVDPTDREESEESPAKSPPTAPPLSGSRDGTREDQERQEDEPPQGPQPKQLEKQQGSREENEVRAKKKVNESTPFVAQIHHLTSYSFGTAYSTPMPSLQLQIFNTKVYRCAYGVPLHKPHENCHFCNSWYSLSGFKLKDV